MPTHKQTEVEEIEEILNIILDISQPPVARCRLLSSGFGPSHTLKITEPVTGSKACIGCGNCIDVCSIIIREPRRLERTAQRTSLALETMVGSDCDRCYTCVLFCPQVDTTIKHYIVRMKSIEQMKKLLEKFKITEDYYLDQFLQDVKLK